MVLVQSSLIDIIANDALLTAVPGSPWKPIWRDESHAGHDKAMSMHVAREQAQEESLPNEIPLIVFIGDGVSDLAAAGEADVLFARRGLRLEQHCIEHKIPYKPFTTFLEIKREIEAISREDQQKTGGVGKPVQYNPRANMWRAISSKSAVCVCPFGLFGWDVLLTAVSCRSRPSWLLLLPLARRRCSSGQTLSRNQRMQLNQRTGGTRRMSFLEMTE